MASSSSFIPSKGTQGRKAGVEGEKSGMYKFKLVHKKAPFFWMYCQNVTFEGERSSAAWAANGQPQVFLNPAPWAEHLTCESCERVNRPATGVSELCPRIEAFVISTKECEFLSNEWKLKVDGWARTFEILESCHQRQGLSSAPTFCTVSREGHQEPFERLTGHLCRVVQVARPGGTEFCSCCRGVVAIQRCKSHDSQHVGSENPRYSGEGQEKRPLLSTPQSGRALKNFLVAEIQADHGIKENVRRVPDASAPAPAFVPMAFDSDEEEEEVAAPEAEDEPVGLRELKRKLQEFNDAPLARKRSKLESQRTWAQALLQEANDTLTRENALAPLLDSELQGFKAKRKSITEALRK